MRVIRVPSANKQLFSWICRRLKAPGYTVCRMDAAPVSMLEPLRLGGALELELWKLQPCRREAPNWENSERSCCRRAALGASGVMRLPSEQGLPAKRSTFLSTRWCRWMFSVSPPR
jgi:hypothetical protein